MVHKKPRVLLIHAYSLYEESPLPLVAPIGLFYINGCLVEQEFETKIISVCVCKNKSYQLDDKAYTDEIKKEIELFNPVYVGLNFRNLLGEGTEHETDLFKRLDVYRQSKVVSLIREACGATLIGGGSAFSLQPSLYMKQLSLDYGIVGEGERVFPRLITDLAQGMPVKDIPGLVYINGGTITINPCDCINSLDEISYIEEGDVLLKWDPVWMRNGSIGIQTKKGCAFRCVYCTYPFLYGNCFRMKSPANVVEEIRHYVDTYHAEQIFFADTIFTSPISHSTAVCQAIIDSGLSIRWRGYMHPKGINEKVLSLYKRSGCEQLLLSADSFSDRILRSYRKDFTREDIENAVVFLRQTQIPFAVDCILGGPGEDEESVDESLDFCAKYLEGVDVSFSVGMWFYFNEQQIHFEKPQKFLLENICNGLPAQIGHFIDLNTYLNEADKASLEDFLYLFQSVTENRKEFLLRIFKKVLQSGKGLYSNSPAIARLVKMAQIQCLREKLLKEER